MHVVVGASGQTGSAVMTRLLDRDLPVRAVVRQPVQAQMWRDKGADAVLADVMDREALAAAFSGADAVYMINPPAYKSPDLFEHARKIHSVLISAAERAGVRRIVALSSVGAQHEAGTGNILTTHDLERQLASCNLPVTVLRAANFMENWRSAIHPARAKGVLPSMFLPIDRALPMQSAADVGAAAADLMVEGGASRRMVELHGPQDYSPEDAAAVLADLLGHPVTAVAVPRAAWPDPFRAQQLPDRTVQGYCEMFDGFNTGHIAFEGASETLFGTTTLHLALSRLVASGDPA